MRYLLFLIFMTNAFLLSAQSQFVQYHFPIPINSPNLTVDKEFRLDIATTLDQARQLQGLHTVFASFAPFENIRIGGGYIYQHRNFDTFSTKSNHKINGFQMQLGLVRNSLKIPGMQWSLYGGLILSTLKDLREYSNLGVISGFENGFSDYKFNNSEYFGQLSYGYFKNGNVSIRAGCHLKVSSVSTNKIEHVSNFRKVELETIDFREMQIGPYFRIGFAGFWFNVQASGIIRANERTEIFAGTDNQQISLFTGGSELFGAEELYFQVGIGKTFNTPIKNNSK